MQKPEGTVRVVFFWRPVLDQYLEGRKEEFPPEEWGKVLIHVRQNIPSEETRTEQRAGAVAY